MKQSTIYQEQITRTDDVALDHEELFALVRAAVGIGEEQIAVEIFLGRPNCENALAGEPLTFRFQSIKTRERTPQ